MFPAASTATPSAVLVPELSGSGSGSGMKAVTQPSFALPIRIPLFHPGFRLVFDSESAEYIMSFSSMYNPLGRPNWVHVASYVPSWSKIWIRLLYRSPTNNRPRESIARAWGSWNSSLVVPVFPQDLMKVPSLENLAIRLSSPRPR